MALNYLRAGARLQCMCLTAKGQQCKNKAKEGSIYCGRHTTCKRPMDESKVVVVKDDEEKQDDDEPVATTRDKRSCKGLKKTKDPKCEEQEGCYWGKNEKGRGACKTREAREEKMEAKRGAGIPMLDLDGNLLHTCSKARQEVDLSGVTLGEGTVMYKGKRLKLELIGSGTYGKVYAARSKDGTIELAIKYLTHEGEAEVEEKAFRLIEKNGMCNVVRGMGTNENAIIMPKMDGDLRSLIAKLHPTTVVEVCKSLAQTLHCLLVNNIMYTDIKPANTLYKCTGKGTFDILLGDVGDVFLLEKGTIYDEYISTFPYPYKTERKDSSKYNPTYSDLLDPMTIDTAEHHLVWGVACFFFVMLKQANVLPLVHDRNYTNQEFLDVRKDLAKSTIPEAAIFARALVDPTSVTLLEMMGRQKKSNRMVKKERKVREVSLTTKQFKKMQVMGYKELRPRQILDNPNMLDEYIGWYASEKIDGWQAIWDGQGTLYTKTYKRKFAVPDRWMNLLPNVPMAGEIKIKGQQATKTASLMKRNPLWDETYFHVFDVVGPDHVNKPFKERVEIIKETVRAACQTITDCPLIAAPQIIMRSRKDILDFYKEVLHSEGEGLVITNPDSTYDSQSKRSNQRVKLKGRNDAEGEVTGYNMGGKKGMRSLNVAFNGTSFHLGIGFTNAQRADPERYFPIGTMVTFSYRDLSDNGKPKEARLVRVRGDI